MGILRFYIVMAMLIVPVIAWITAGAWNKFASIILNHAPTVLIIVYYLQFSSMALQNLIAFSSAIPNSLFSIIFCTTGQSFAQEL